ncbi:PH domain-containing protein [Flavobacterium tibetense]|uniref:Uncharacterized protein YyaB-like PH domain-containing protein n=1 Tax=Flavobacterium tibetense TaxID=2233533 RepID=A0A365P1I3_9FLAO|nr:PH domain-containing protein [Flavobacterium tibetense]RBA28337.1 hypothetical protein DPN68_07870 [Flavobacterium tibetense]
MKFYPSAKHKLTIWLYWFLMVFMLVILVFPILEEGFTLPIILISIFHLVFIIFFITILFNTNYRIQNEELFCKSSVFRSKIKIKNIRKIEHHKGIIVPVTWKLGLSHIGIIITYNKYDDIYISPENVDLFIKDLLAINPTIEIIQAKK